MSERGLPIVDGAPACPFVAFEDDRDARSTAPDHRHRCFAEPRPAPRALAHQEAYCLSSAFPVCPTFQDWARREAAAARPTGNAGRPADSEPPVSRSMPPLDRDEYRPTGTETPPPASQRRPAQRDWAAPPPWAAGAATGAAAGAAAADAGLAATPPEARGLAGSAADRLAGPDPSDPLSPAPSRPEADAGATPSHATWVSDEHADDAWSPPTGEAADDGDAGRPDTEDDRIDHPAAAAGAAAGAAAWAAGGADLDDGPDWAQDERYAAPVSPRPSVQPLPDRSAPNPHDQVSRRPPQDPADLFGPAWERPRRSEAYPSLKTHVGLPGMGGIGRVGLGALALIVAALALFFVGPMLLGIGSGDQPGTGATGASPTPLVEASASLQPTPVPQPTPIVYVVKKGDTMSKIAKKYKLTVDELLAANPQIKNPNKISIGDEVNIPGPQSDGASASASSAP